MIVHQIQVGSMQNFCYVVSDEQTNECIIIDPSWDLDKIEDIISKNDLHVKYIVNTHHHFDHTVGNKAMSDSTGAQIVQHESSELDHDVAVKDGETIKFGNSELKIVHTPGHSQDSICLVGDGKIFSGDTLFVGNCGRVDLPGGSSRDLYHSLFDILYGLDDELILYCGHNYGMSETSTIGKEKKTNPVMQKISEHDFVQMMGS